MFNASRRARFPLSTTNGARAGKATPRTPSGQSGGKTIDTFVQVMLFHQGEWAVRYEITCPLTDRSVLRVRQLSCAQ
jgi:hypothetical protein